MIIREKVMVQKPLNVVLRESKIENSQEVVLKESVQGTDILSMSFADIKQHNGGDNMKTLRELNELMSKLQGSDDNEERKAYFKAKRLYQQLTKVINK